MIQHDSPADCRRAELHRETEAVDTVSPGESYLLQTTAVPVDRPRFIPPLRNRVKDDAFSISDQRG